jgi:hypothetical protein
MLARFTSVAMLALALGLVASLARAQSAEELQAAGHAFQEGQRAQMRGDYAQAAEMFDLANHTAPSAAALRSAIRMHQSAGHHAAAATRAAHALATYPDDAATVEMASQVIAGCGPLTGHVVITCEPTCALTIGGRVVSADTARADLYLDPGTHVLRASWPGHRSLERTLEAAVGSNQEVALRSSDPEVVSSESVVTAPPAEEVSGPTTPPSSGGPTPTPSSSSGLSPVFFAIAAGLTVAAAATTIGLGIDMLDARNRYVLMPTEAGWRDGVGRETATNALLGTSLALAAVTVGLAIFTDWDGEPSTSEQALLHHFRFAASPDGAAAQLHLDF